MATTAANAMKTLNVRRGAEAALHNEYLTRQRVERIEALLSRGFWGRLKWVLLGR